MGLGSTGLFLIWIAILQFSDVVVLVELGFDFDRQLNVLVKIEAGAFFTLTPVATACVILNFL